MKKIYPAIAFLALLTLHNVPAYASANSDNVSKRTSIEEREVYREKLGLPTANDKTSNSQEAYEKAREERAAKRAAAREERKKNKEAEAKSKKAAKNKAKPPRGKKRHVNQHAQVKKAEASLGPKRETAAVKKQDDFAKVNNAANSLGGIGKVGVTY